MNLTYADQFGTAQQSNYVIFLIKLLMNQTRPYALADTHNTMHIFNQAPFDK
jgi:hypothetical protein